MSKELERAELIQSLSAYLIPSSLFIACLIMAAGSFLVYNGFSLGWALVAVSLAVITGAFVLFFRFQNKHRAAGKFPEAEKAESTNP